MVTQVVRRQSRALGAVLLALELAAFLFALIFFALLIEYTETAFRIVPLRAVQLAVSLLLGLGLGRLRGLLNRAYEYRFERGRLVISDVRHPRRPLPLWSVDSDAILSWGRVNQPPFQRLLADAELPRHPYFVHRGAELYYIHYRDHGGEGLTVIEPDDAAVGFLMEIAAGKRAAEEAGA